VIELIYDASLVSLLEIYYNGFHSYVSLLLVKFIICLMGGGGAILHLYLFCVPAFNYISVFVLIFLMSL
jgi:hypothetical protein